MASLPTALAATAPDGILDLCRRFHVRRLDLIGSATDGRFDPLHSDLDFVVVFEDLPGSAYFELRAALTELFGRDVDLLTEATLANPYLRRQVEAQRQRLFPPI